MTVKTPPMGWNTWNTFGKDINEKLIMETADVIIEKGYKEAGYEYVVIDDCWSEKSRCDGKLVPDKKKFPNGMKYVADYIHSKGLKFGMYSCAGFQTCARYPGSFGYEYIDAQTFADWGVDFLKYDYCFYPSRADCKNSYLTMANALRCSGRDILFSACNWGSENCTEWMRSVGAHMYRSTGDIFDNFESIKNIFLSQENNFNRSGFGSFNDIDMLVCGMYGNGNVSTKNANGDAEYKTHFALWCMFSAPLMIGGDIRNMNGFCHKLLTNKNLIAINQDEDARPPIELKVNTHYDGIYKRYIKLLSDGDIAFGAFNLGDYGTRFEFYPKEAGFPSYSGVKFSISDLFTGEELGTFTDMFDVGDVQPHDCRMYRIKVVK